VPDAIPFLAKLYADPRERAGFLAAPYETALAAGFDSAAASALAAIDPLDLTLAGRSFDTKRSRAHR
jgi:hypothetical protein